ncbi:TetR/AcrR family transcriptional regulator C-terminal domain-containing protein [Nocardia sp. CA2R105]|uniref:TetR/AcrR family transcriptional regulator n=1 Tax=Nocardia coffeae TaxID=2873381 RepID=UPI001CA6DFFD|nr:TetR/AcrR family transcriptional regulator C-terminal domain-containing protein [Nocardia coffeae]MBY8857437.1 TetR/AcrR family transcriptional regulator C-terminal domain-containing protein [Nocardia coffeae]
MAKRVTAPKRPRRERGSLNPEDIIDGAFELAEQVSLDNLSMPMLGKHLDVGVTSIYWYFRKKDDLLNAMTDRALHQYGRFAGPFVEAGDWRESLRHHARTMRKTFLQNPILCDLILIRSALSPEAAQLGARGTEQVIANLMQAGLTLDDAVDTYSAVQLHVRGTVVLQRLYDKNKESDAGASAYYENLTISPDTTPLLAAASVEGRHNGAPDEHNFEYGLERILEHADRLIAASAVPAAKPPAARPTRRAAAAK